MALPRWVKPLLLVLLLVPMAWLAIQWLPVLSGGEPARALTADPVAETTRQLGIWSLRILLVALAVTPAVRLTGYTPLITVRRMVGLTAFAYVLVHWSFWMWLDLDWSFSELVKEVAKRWFILAGMVGFLCLLPLAITSTRGWIKRIGARRWQGLHSLAYVAGVAGCVHYAMVLKGNQPSPKIYLAILALLLAVRYMPQQTWLRPRRRPALARR